MHRKQFTFYRSFAEVIKNLPTKSEKLQAYEMLIDYGLDQNEPDLEALKPSVATIFRLVQPVMDTAHKRASMLQTANKLQQFP